MDKKNWKKNVGKVGPTPPKDYSVSVTNLGEAQTYFSFKIVERIPFKIFLKFYSM